MDNNITRPVNLNFFTLQFPITAIISILHRISGIVLFLLIPAVLWVLQESLASEARWQILESLFKSAWVKGLCWVMLTSLIYHGIAGIRHLLLDIHVGETKMGGRVGAYSVVFFSVLLAVLLGYRLWS